MAAPNLELYDEAMQRFISVPGEARVLEPSEPNAMTLATSDRDGRPTARTVTLKDVSKDRLVFYTSETSVKGVQIAENSQACAVFFWRRLMEQVVVDGDVKVLDEKTIDKHVAYRVLEGGMAASQRANQLHAFGHWLVQAILESVNFENDALRTR